MGVLTVTSLNRHASQISVAQTGNFKYNALVLAFAERVAERQLQVQVEGSSQPAATRCQGHGIAVEFAQSPGSSWVAAFAARACVDPS
jgi:hypothetical protein